MIGGGSFKLKRGIDLDRTPQFQVFATTEFIGL
jgi:hypothetical protein